MAGCGRLFVPVGPINFLNSRCLFINSFQCISVRAKKSMEKSLFPNKPKKPLTPFFKYLETMRPSFVNNFPKAKITDIVKKISEKWATEDSDYKLQLHEQYDAEYKEYMKNIIEFEKSITSEQREMLMALEDKIQRGVVRTNRNHRLHLLGKPKKPPSAFFLYTNEQIKAENYNNNIKDFVKKLSLQWKNLSEEDKKQYHIRAAELMAQYHKQKTEWEQKMIQEDHLPTDRQVTPSYDNIIMENDEKYIPKSNDEDMKRSGFFMRTLKKITNNLDILKEHIKQRDMAKHGNATNDVFQQVQNYIKVVNVRKH